MIAKTPLTVKGAELLRAELHELKTVQRPAIITAIVFPIVRPLYMGASAGLRSSAGGRR